MTSSQTTGTKSLRKSLIIKSKSSFYEQGVYDISAEIDYILNKTGQKNLQIIAGSLGGSIMISLLATKPEYNDKVSKALLLGPGGPFSRFTTYTQKIMFAAFAISKVCYWIIEKKLKSFF